MKIELLNVRIYLSKNAVTVDSIGNHKTSGSPTTPAMPRSVPRAARK